MFKCSLLTFMQYHACVVNFIVLYCIDCPRFLINHNGFTVMLNQYANSSVTVFAVGVSYSAYHRFACCCSNQIHNWVL